MAKKKLIRRERLEYPEPFARLTPAQSMIKAQRLDNVRRLERYAQYSPYHPTTVCLFLAGHLLVDYLHQINGKDPTEDPTHASRTAMYARLFLNDLLAPMIEAGLEGDSLLERCKRLGLATHISNREEQLED